MAEDLYTGFGNQKILAERAKKDINGNSLELTIENEKVTAIGGVSIGGGSEPVDAYTKAETNELLGGKANKSEMSVTPGTDADDDKTTIQLKTGTSTTVLTKHQDVSSMLGKSEFGGTILDTSGEPITDDTGEAIQDETMVELYDSFETTKFGAERARADASGHDIETTYATKSEVSTAISRIESVASARTDASGNDIETTYATKQELTGYATSNDVSTISDTINSLDETYATKDELNTALGNIETLLDAL